MLLSRTDSPGARNDRLDVLARDRDNNFNLLRFCLATMVLVHHAFVLTGHPAIPVNLALRFVAGLGEIGVDGFFVISGFLVTRSLIAKPRVGKFLLARALRIFPGLWVMLVLTTLALTAMSTLDPIAYLGSLTTWKYVVANATAFFITYDLPGVFSANPSAAINGSLWSLRYEVMCYIALAAAGAFGLAQRRWPLALVAAACALAYLVLPADPGFVVGLVRRLGFMFALGATFAAYAGYIPIRGVIAAGGFAAALALDWTPIAPIGWGVAFAYFLLWFAYVPRGAIRHYNRLPDVSYGMYIYAFPIQQTAIALGWGAMPGANMLIAIPLTLACATASWYLIEAPGLRLKNALARRDDPRLEHA